MLKLRIIDLFLLQFPSTARKIEHIIFFCKIQKRKRKRFAGVEGGVLHLTIVYSHSRAKIVITIRRS